MTTATDSPGGVPQPADDQAEPVRDFEPAEIVADPAGGADSDGADGDGQEEEEEEEGQGGLPLAQVLMGGTCLLGLGGGVLYQAWGLTGLAAGAAVPTAGVAAYVRHRRDRRTGGRTGAGTAWWGGETRRPGRAGTASLLPGLGGGRSGRSGSGRRGGGGRPGGSGSTGGRSGGKAGAGFRVPSWGGSGSGSGRGAGGGRGGSAAGAGGRRGGKAGGGAGGSKGTTAGGGSKGSAAASRTGAGRRAAAGGGPGGRGAAGRVTERARRAVRAADAKTGYRASRSVRAAGRWVDALTGGRAGEAAKTTRARVRKARKGLAALRRYRGTAQVSLGLGLAAAALAGPWTALVALVAALGGGLAWWRWRRRAKTAAAADQAETTKTTETAAEAGDDAKTGQEQAAGGKTGAGPGMDQAAAFAAAAGGPRPRPRTNHNPRDHRERRSTIVGGFPLTVAAAEMSATAARYAPQDMWAVDKELEQLPDLPGYVALALRTYVQRLNAEYPIHPAVLEKFYELCKGQADLAARAQEITALFKQAHQHDIARDEARRVNEHLWNV